MARMNEESRLGSIAARLDDLPTLPFHRKLFGQVAVGLFFDIFDLYIAAAVSSALVATGWATLSELASLTSVTLAGMMLGSLSAGFVGDRLGRRAVFRWSLVFVALSSLIAALAPNIETLLAARFMTCLGLGAEAVLAYAAFAEFLPRALRGRWVGFMAMTGNTAVIVAAIAGYIIIPLGGWRWLFVIGAVGAAVGWIVRRNMPESPRWLEARGRHDEALQILDAVAPTAHVDKPRPPAASVVLAAAADNNESLIRSLLVAGVMNATLYVSIFAFLTWLPSLMVAEGKALPKSLLMNVFMSCGALVGTAASGFIAELSGRRQATSLLAAASATLAIVYAIVPSPEAQGFIGFLMYTSVYALAGVSVFIYAPELFPTKFRLRGAGSAVAIGRACAMAAPFAIPSLFIEHGLIGVGAALATILIVEIVIVLVFGTETKGRALS